MCTLKVSVLLILVEVTLLHRFVLVKVYDDLSGPTVDFKSFEFRGFKCSVPTSDAHSAIPTQKWLLLTAEIHNKKPKH